MTIATSNGSAAVDNYNLQLANLRVNVPQLQAKFSAEKAALAALLAAPAPANAKLLEAHNTELAQAQSDLAMLQKRLTNAQAQLASLTANPVVLHA